MPPSITRGLSERADRMANALRVLARIAEAKAVGFSVQVLITPNRPPDPETGVVGRSFATSTTMDERLVGPIADHLPGFIQTLGEAFVGEMERQLHAVVGEHLAEIWPMYDPGGASFLDAGMASFLEPFLGAEMAPLGEPPTDAPPLDPEEPGISRKERSRRLVLLARERNEDQKAEGPVEKAQGIEEPAPPPAPEEPRSKADDIPF